MPMFRIRKAIQAERPPLVERWVGSGHEQEREHDPERGRVEDVLALDLDQVLGEDRQGAGEQERVEPRAAQQKAQAQPGDEPSRSR
ncbi:MAG: hypothetical protein ACXVYV_06120 [Gaiellales bacterium]